MEIKEIDGKKFIEFDEHQEQKKRLIISIIFLILMVVAIIALINVTATLIKNKNIIQSDPLTYGMEAHGFVSCSCFDEEGRNWYSKDGGFIYESRGKNWINYSSPKYKINYSNLKVIDGAGRNN